MKNIFNKKALFVLIILFAMSFVSGMNNFFAAATATSINFEEKIILPNTELIDYIKADLALGANAKMKKITPTIDKVLKVLGKTKDDIVSLHADPNTPGTKIEITELKNLTMKHQYVKNIFATSPANLPLVNQSENLKLKAYVNFIIIEMMFEFINRQNKFLAWTGNELPKLSGKQNTTISIQDLIMDTFATRFKKTRKNADTSFVDAFKEIFEKRTEFDNIMKVGSTSKKDNIAIAFATLLTKLSNEVGLIPTINIKTNNTEINMEKDTEINLEKYLEENGEEIPNTKEESSEALETKPIKQENAQYIEKHINRQVNNDNKTISDIMWRIKSQLLQNKKQTAQFLNDFNVLCENFFKKFFDDSDIIKNQADLAIFFEPITTNAMVKEGLFKNTDTALYETDKGKFFVADKANNSYFYNVDHLGHLDKEKAINVFDNVIIQYFKEQETNVTPTNLGQNGGTTTHCSQSNCVSKNSTTPNAKDAKICQGCYNAAGGTLNTQQQGTPSNQQSIANTQIKKEIEESIGELGALTTFEQQTINKGVKALQNGKTEIEKLEAKLIIEEAKLKAEDIKELEDLRKEKTQREQKEKKLTSKIQKPGYMVSAGILIGTPIGVAGKKYVFEKQSNNQIDEQGKVDNSIPVNSQQGS